MEGFKMFGMILAGGIFAIGLSQVLAMIGLE